MIYVEMKITLCLEFKMERTSYTNHIKGFFRWLAINQMFGNTYHT